MIFFQLTLLGTFLYVSHYWQVEAVCPFLTSGTVPDAKLPDVTVPRQGRFNRLLPTLDIAAVFSDIYDVMDNSNECFPADEFNGESSYAGLFLRLAWHCAGTFRATDNAGGCASARQRFLPESAWDDNVNLDKARALLAPIKFKYGDALSWSDLIIFAGNAAILNGDGPIIEVCAGRVDEPDGSSGVPLNDFSTCDDDLQNCQPPLGTSTAELIYVNPQGVEADGDPTRSAPRIREIFGRMGMNDLETVALIGGGHAFGKCHGACPLGPGPGPDEDPKNPWPGMCGDNFPEDTFTSGIEGQWTSFPFQWDNEYFKLLNDDIDLYRPVRGPGGAIQYNNTENGLLMLVTDIAFTRDTEYQKIVKRYAENIDDLDFYFSMAWAKLTTSGGRMASNAFCVGPDVVRPPGKDDSCERSMRTPFTRRFLRFCYLFGEYFEFCDRECENDEFRFSDDFACEKCSDIFGDKCLECADEVGCVTCAPGSQRAVNSCGLYYCMPDHY